MTVEGLGELEKKQHSLFLNICVCTFVFSVLLSVCLKAEVNRVQVNAGG